MNPISLNDNKKYISKFSTYEDSIVNGDTLYSYDNTLKYRFNHLAKLDVEATYKGFSIGISARYNSYMKNIDAIFEDELIPEQPAPPGSGQEPTPALYILPGLKDYRARNNNGTLVFDARIGYKFLEHYRLGFIINNIFNAEYSSRPGDIQAPRTLIIQLQAKF